MFLYKGKGYLNAGDKQWGIGSMQHDLTDAVKWAVENGIAISNQVAIYGVSLFHQVLLQQYFDWKIICCL